VQKNLKNFPKWGIDDLQHSGYFHSLVFGIFFRASAEKMVQAGLFFNVKHASALNYREFIANLSRIYRE
jgi:hypothetical protein